VNLRGKYETGLLPVRFGRIGNPPLQAGEVESEVINKNQMTFLSNRAILVPEYDRRYFL